jgi:hypothetical protein
MPLKEKPVLERARAEIAAGRLWKARDRLAGAIRFDRYDQAVLELLGEVHFLMGDLPEAGRCWFLTECSGFEAEQARNALEERFGRDPALVLEWIPFGGELELYPPVVRLRLEQLIAQAETRGERLLEARRRGRQRGRDGERGKRGVLAGCLMIVVAALAISILVGAVLRGFEGLLRLLF